MSKECALEIKKLSISFFDNTILEDFDFSLRNGEIHALLGQNATGKSTLVKILAGILEPPSGEIVVNGTAFSSLNIKSAKKLGIYAINQSIQLIRNLTAQENVFLQTVGMIYSPRKTKKKFDALKKELHIEVDGQKEASELSAGEKRLVELMRAYVFNPKILILDEPAAYFSFVESDNMHRIIKMMQAKGTSILYITHKIKDALAISDRISVLFDGRITTTFSPGSCKDTDIITMMTGKSHKNRFPKICHITGSELLSAHNLTSDILKDISFSLHEGEILGITGISGSGKTLLARALVGAYNADGEVFYHPGGQIIKSEHAASKCGIGYIAEEASQNNIPMFMARMNITLADLGRMCAHGFIRLDSEKDLENRYFHDMNIRNYADDRDTGQYSGGEQQKISLARQFFKDSNVLIVDEPAKFVDIPSKNDIYNLFNQYVSQKKGIIFLSSDFAEVCGMCDRILVLNYGRIVKEFNYYNVREEDVVTYAMMSAVD